MGIEASIQILSSAEIQNSLFFIIYGYTRKSEKYVTSFKLRKISGQKPPASYVFPAMKSAINFGPEKIGFKQF